MAKKIKVVVLMGGRSPEHEISLISGREVVKNLSSKFLVLPVVISRDGRRWLGVSSKNLLALPDPLTFLGTNKEIVKLSQENRAVNSQNVSKDVDVFFIAMHGPFGEDGTIQGLLEMASVRYTGSGVLASALGMDKIMFRKVMEKEGVRVPKYIYLNKGDKHLKIKKQLGRPPYFVKPSDQGSSVGASIARKSSGLPTALKLAFKYGRVALIDEYLAGKEVTCAVLGNKDPLALPIIEIVPLKGEFFDYQSKYTESGAQEIVPARISGRLTKEVQTMAIKVHKALGCRGFSRVDFILKNNKTPFVLEINTIPGLTPMSLLPKAALAAGISYPRLLDKIINYALE